MTILNKKGKNMKAILGIEVDGESFGAELGFEALENVVYSIPDIEENADLFAALARHPYPRIRSNVAEKENLDDETLMLLADDKDPEVLGRVVYSESFRRLASEEQVKNILMQENDASVNIISYAASFKRVSVEEIEQAIKDSDIQNPNILRAAADCYDFTSEYIEELTQHSDPSVSMAAKRQLKNR
jgi:hypothetical protein